MITLALLAALVAPSSTWTVDDDGPADFTQITDAIAKAAPGDVLLVESGEYEPFILEKPLTVLGRPGSHRPHVHERSLVIGSGLTLAGLDLDFLRVSEVADRVRIDDCALGDLDDAGQAYALELDACAQAVVSRTQAMGSQVYSNKFLTVGGTAMGIVTSNVTLVDCGLRGADGASAAPFSELGGPGGLGLDVRDGSRVVAVGSEIDGGWEGPGFGFGTCIDGNSGTGLKVVGSSVVLRGEADGTAWVLAGFADSLCGLHKGKDIDAAQSTVVISGVSFDPANVKLGAEAALIQPAVPEPLLVTDGADTAGTHKTIRLHGPAGASCLLVASFAPAYAPLAQFDDKLWVGLSGFFVLVPLTTAGQDQPIALGFHVPASLDGLEGLSIELQPFFPGLASAYAPSQSIAGNVADIVLRF